MFSLALWSVIGFLVLAFVYVVFRAVRFSRATNRGTAALTKGCWEEAERHFQGALKIAQGMKNGGSDSQVVAWLHLSVLAAKRGQKEESIRLAGSAIEAMKNVRCGYTGNFHHVFAHVADVLEENGEFDDAVQFRRLEVKAIPATTIQDGEKVTLSLIHLARTLKRADRPAEAVTAYESVCKLPQTSNVAHARMEMASMLKKLGKHTEAEREFEHAIAMFKKAEGDDGVNVGIALSNFGVFYSSVERFGEALAVYNQSLEIRGRRFGETSDRYAVAQNNCANCLRQLGRLEEAESMARSSISILRAQKHKSLPNALDTMGLTVRDSGRLEEAREHLAEACAILKAKPNRDSSEYKEFSGHYADVLTRLGCDAEAADCSAEAQEVNEARKHNRALASLLDGVLAGMNSGSTGSDSRMGVIGIAPKL